MASFCCGPTQILAVDRRSILAASYFTIVLLFLPPLLTGQEAAPVAGDGTSALRGQVTVVLNRAKDGGGRGGQPRLGQSRRSVGATTAGVMAGWHGN